MKSLSIYPDTGSLGHKLRIACLKTLCWGGDIVRKSNRQHKIVEKEKKKTQTANFTNWMCQNILQLNKDKGFILFKN